MDIYIYICIYIDIQYSCLGNPWTEEPGGLQSVGLQRVG